MKFIQIIILTVVSGLLFNACKSADKTANVKESIENIVIDENGDIIITAIKGIAFEYPTLAIWTESMNGDYLKTIYISESYASGIYSHEMVGDTMWLDKQGPSYQPSALPYWTHKKGIINGKSLVPTPDNPYVDAYSGPTPKTSFRIKSNDKHTKPYRILFEINQFGDWNMYWTNNKFPSSDAYKHSAQPSIVYAVTINDQDSIFYLNPVGHGDPLGTSGKLFTDLSTLSTSLKIIEQIQVKTK